MTRPDVLDAETVRRLRETFTDDQLVELTLKVLKFNTQKINVTLGTHRWVPPGDVATASWNTDATYVPAD